MTNYFNYPYAFCKAKGFKAEGNPSFCQNQSISFDHLSGDNVSSNCDVKSINDETTFVIAERSYNLPSFTEEELQTEQWKKIVGFPYYWISSLGRVYSLKTHKILRPCFSSAQKRSLSSSAIISLYDYITRDKKGRFKRYPKSISLLVKDHFMFVPKSLEGSKSIIVVHKNNNPFDNRLSNLIITSLKKRLHFPKKVEIERFVLLRSVYIDFILKLIKEGKVKEISIFYEDDNIVIIECPKNNCSVFLLLWDLTGNMFAWSDHYVMLYHWADDVKNHLEYIFNYALNNSLYGNNCLCYGDSPALDNYINESLGIDEEFLSFGEILEEGFATENGFISSTL